MYNPARNNLPNIQGVVPHGIYFYFSKLVYDIENLEPTRFSATWSLLAKSTDPEVGLQAGWLEFGKSAFFAAAYISHQLNCIVIAVQGSNALGDWIHHNRNIAVGSFPDSVSYLEAFYTYIKTYNDRNYGYPLSFTGHSQGALCAEVIACANNLTAVTFECPGSLMALYAYAPRFTGKLSFIRSAYILSYVSLPNLVNRTHQHIGLVVHVYSENVVKLYSGPERAGHVFKSMLGAKTFQQAAIMGLFSYAYTHLKDAAVYNLQAHSIDNFSTLLDGDPVLHLCEYWPLREDELAHLYKKGGSHFSISKQALNLNRINLNYFPGSYLETLGNRFDLKKLANNRGRLLPHFRVKNPEKISSYLGVIESFSIEDDHLISHVDNLNVLELYFAINSFFAMLDDSYHKYFYSKTNPACVITYKLNQENKAALAFIGWLQTEAGIEIIPKTYFGQILTAATRTQLENYRFENRPLLPEWTFATNNPQTACTKLNEIANTLQYPAEAHHFRQLAEFIRNTMILRQPIEETAAEPDEEIQQGANRGDIDYARPNRVQSWQAEQNGSGIYGLLALPDPDGKFLTANGGCVCLWNPRSENIDIRETRWGIPCIIRDHSCVHQLIPIGNYILAASGHFCNYINLTTKKLMQTPQNIQCRGFNDNVKFVIYRNRYIIFSPGGRGRYRNFAIWDIETQQIASEPAGDGFYHGAESFLLLRKDLLIISAANDTEHHAHLYRIDYTPATDVYSLTKLNKVIKGICLRQNGKKSQYHQNYNIAWLNEVGNYDEYACLYGTFGDVGELCGIAIFNTNPANTHLTKIAEPYVRKLFDVDDHYFLTISNERSDPRVIVKLWKKSTRTVEKESYFKVRKYNQNTIQEIIKLSDSCIALNTLEGIHVFNRLTGDCTPIAIWQHVHGHGSRVATLAVLSNNSVVIGAVRPGQNGTDNIFLYQYY